MPLRKEKIEILANKIVCFDCDDTLVMWYDKPENIPGAIYIEDPYKNGGYYLVPHDKHIKKLKGYSRSGWFVIIWSAGGGPWAKAVRDALDLKEYTNLTIGKPEICYDDLPVGEGIGRRAYFPPKKPKEVTND